MERAAAERAARATTGTGTTGNKNMGNKTMGIGALARRTGTKVQTIRYYEEIGLMPRPERTAGGQRRYTKADLDRLAFIRHAREMGFSLEMIRELLALADEPAQERAAPSRGGGAEDPPPRGAEARARAHDRRVPRRAYRRVPGDRGAGRPWRVPDAPPCGAGDHRRKPGGRSRRGVLAVVSRGGAIERGIMPGLDAAGPRDSRKGLEDGPAWKAEGCLPREGRAPSG